MSYFQKKIKIKCENMLLLLLAVKMQIRKQLLPNFKICYNDVPMQKKKRAREGFFIPLLFDLSNYVIFIPG